MTTTYYEGTDVQEYSFETNDSAPCKETPTMTKTEDQQAQQAITDIIQAAGLFYINAADHCKKNADDLAEYIEARCAILRQTLLDQHAAPAPRPEYHIDEKKVQVVMRILRRYEQPQTQREVEDTLCPDYALGNSHQYWLDRALPSELASWIMGRFADSRLAPSDNSK